jgi:uncharacterized protein YjiS (DUF1127 family)
MSTQSVLYRKNASLRAEARQPLWNGFTEIFLEWRRRARSRRELASLSYPDIKDIGYPADIAAEKNKPFWRR